MHAAIPEREAARRPPLSRWRRRGAFAAGTLAIVALRLQAEALAAAFGAIALVYLVWATMAAILLLRAGDSAGDKPLKSLAGAYLLALLLVADVWRPSLGSVQVASALAAPAAAYLLFAFVRALRADPGPTFGTRLLAWFVPARMVPLVAAELRLLIVGFFHWKRPVLGPRQFTSKLILGPVLIAVACLTVVEMAILHLVLMQWSASAAWGLTILSLIMCVYMIGIFKSLTLKPTELSSERLTVRLGHLREIEVPYGDIARIERGEALQKAEQTANLAIMSAPNVRITLREPQPLADPFGNRRTIERIALRLDSPDEFVRALRARAPAAA